MRVEFLLAYEDKTWETHFFDVPEYFDNAFVSSEDIEIWWQETHGENYKNIVVAVVYSMPCRNFTGIEEDEE